MKTFLTLFAAILIASLVLDAAAAAVFTLDRVQQRYPWNGLVDIDYTISGFDGDAADYNVVFSVTYGGTR